jgi:hypothetical protein
MKWPANAIESRHTSAFFLAARATGSTGELQSAMKRRQVKPPAGRKTAPQTTLDGIPIAQEKTVSSFAALEALTAQNKVPSCLPKAMPVAGASSPSVLGARFYPCILASACSLNFSVLFG